MNYRIINGYYNLGEQIGEGHYGKVYRAVDARTNTTVAIKALSEIDVNQEEVQKLLKLELQVLKTLNHKNIIKLLDHFVFMNTEYVVYEYCKDGDLYRKIEKEKRLPEATALISSN